MAFVKLEDWEPSLGAPLSLPAPLRERRTHPYLARAAEVMRRPLAILLSMAAHGIAAWLLLAHVRGGETSTKATVAAHVLTLIPLADEDDGVWQQPESELVRSSPTPPAELAPQQATARTQPVEWSVTRIRVAIANPIPTAAPSMATTLAPPISASAGNDGGAYDPYAGAAPQRREDMAGRPPSPGMIGKFLTRLGLTKEASEPDIDMDLLERVRQNVQRDTPGTTETIRLTVRISPTGMVLDANVTNGAPSPAARRMIMALLGKRLIRVEQPLPDAREMPLPPLRLG